MTDTEPLPRSPAEGSVRTAGVLGGMSSESTAEYYRLLNEGVNDELGGDAAADVLVQSVNFGDIKRCIRDDRWGVAGEYLAAASRRLERGGAEFVVMATNTMHKVAPEIDDALSIPFYHIVDVTADAISDAGIDTVGVLGTQVVTEHPFYRDRFADHGIDVVVPTAEDRARADSIVFDELCAGRVLDDSRDEYVRMMEEMVAEGAEGIVLGCTEIELLVGPEEFSEVPLFDTTALHVERAVERSVADL